LSLWSPSAVLDVAYTAVLDVAYTAALLVAAAVGYFTYTAALLVATTVVGVALASVLGTVPAVVGEAYSVVLLVDAALEDLTRSALLLIDAVFVYPARAGALLDMPTSEHVALPTVLGDPADANNHPATVYIFTLTGHGEPEPGEKVIWYILICSDEAVATDADLIPINHHPVAPPLA